MKSLRTFIFCFMLGLAAPASLWNAIGQSSSQARPKPQMMSVKDDGKPRYSKYRVKDLKGQQLVKTGISAPKGLEGRHIAMWQSHGMYYKIEENKWKWQRPSMFQTTEDLFTQSFVVPFLTPMLENAGANVLLPRERDWHTSEIIIDNDPSEQISGRIHGHMEYDSKWKKMTNGGFADKKAVYTGTDNPFRMGTHLKNTTSKKGKESIVSWYAAVPERGEYAVYVSYTASSKSTTAARYTVHTAGGPVEVRVNQRMGGDCWVYIGTYEFEGGEQELVSLSNRSTVDGNIVTADAIKIGGGMGNIARAHKDSLSASTSGMPRFAEGARYFMQWSGIPEKVWSQNEFNDDYRDDLMSRGQWVQYLSGKSWVYPNAKEGLNIPIDFSFAWHTDAGVKPDATVVGTLGIYTLRSELGTKLRNGRTRATSRELTELILGQLDNDLGRQWDSLWTIRDLWNRSYSESRTTGTPAVLLELLSHQNFEDMKFGLDPAFRFSASRAVYKAMLKYLSMRYGCSYVVQPLPVRSFSAMLAPLGANGLYDHVQLRWKDTPDSLEQTAVPTSFIVYTRTDRGGWDSGIKVEASADEKGFFGITMPVDPGHIYSYKVVAANEGGISFPSEILSVGIPQNPDASKVSIVNAFHRISGPKWFDDALMAGFDTRNDSGVPYIRDWSYVGEQFEFDRSLIYDGSESIAFGSCKEDYADVVIAGNSFDYPFVHGSVLLDCGYAFDSCSSHALEEDSSLCSGSYALDIICGKECIVQTATRTAPRGGIYTPDFMSALRHNVQEGRHILISGSYIASEAIAWGREKEVQSMLGYTLRREHGSRNGMVSKIIGKNGAMQFYNKPNPYSYSVESPDALSAFRLGSGIYMKYDDSAMAAGVRTDFGRYKVAAFGFPIEALASEKDRALVIKETMDYFAGR